VVVLVKESLQEVLVMVDPEVVEEVEEEFQPQVVQGIPHQLVQHKVKMVEQEVQEQVLIPKLLTMLQVVVEEQLL
jgi:hypothetical protein